jgi:predicted enzyme related to lactoylglutathione lyase
MSQNELRVVCNVKDFDGSMAFFRDGLEFPITHQWDNGPNDRGALFQAASGTIEILKQAGAGVVDELQGVRIAVQVDDVDASYEQAKGKGLSISMEPTTEAWGARRFWVDGPNGIRMALFTRTD